MSNFSDKEIEIIAKRSEPKKYRGLNLSGQVANITEGLNFLNQDRQFYYYRIYETKITNNFDKKFYNNLENLMKKWIDGRKKRKTDPDILSFKKSIKNYINTKYSQKNIYCLENDVVNSYPDTPLGKQFTSDVIDKLIKINSEVMEEFIEEYSNFNQSSSNTVVTYRGLNLDNDSLKNVTSYVYNELDFLSSYGLSYEVAGKFAKSGSKFNHKVIIHAGYNLIYNRILFSSICFKTFLPKQFEFLVIPHWEPLYCNFSYQQGSFKEYSLDPYRVADDDI